MRSTLGRCKISSRRAAKPRPRTSRTRLAQFVIRAFDYSTITGFWGDIPFSEASKGDQGKIAPAYDKQQVIYDSLLKYLLDANAMMSTSAGGGFGSQDPVYGGDMAKWKKFANSLHARLGMNLSKVDANREL